jgi:hypothetical protein
LVSGSGFGEAICCASFGGESSTSGPGSSTERGERLLVHSIKVQFPDINFQFRNVEKPDFTT